MLQRLGDQIAELPGETLSEIAVQELQRRIRELMHFKLSADDLVHLQEASATMQEALSDSRNLEAVDQAQRSVALAAQRIGASGGSVCAALATSRLPPGW